MAGRFDQWRRGFHACLLAREPRPQNGCLGCETQGKDIIADLPNPDPGVAGTTTGGEASGETVRMVGVSLQRDFDMQALGKK